VAAEKNQIRQRLNGANPKPDKRVITGMQNQLRAQILILLNERVASRPEICKELGAPFDKVRYEMEVLKNSTPPLIEQVAKRPVRGTYELFYRATTRAYLDPSEWPVVPDAVKGGLRGSLLDILVEDAVAAVSEGTFDSLENAHLSWTPLIVDGQGWEEIIAILLRAMEEVIKVKDASAERLIAGDEEGTSCTVSMLGYPSFNKARKVGPPTGAEVLVGDSTDSPRKKGKKATAGKAAPKPKRKNGGG
jgi:hypothetical protein